MSDRPLRALQVLVLALAGVLAWQLAQWWSRPDPLASLRGSALPDIATASIEPGGGKNDSPGRAPAALPTHAQKQVDQVTSSEVFGAIPRPLPMAVLGIGGWDAIIRTPSGQTELLRVGEESGGVKLLQIGTNRVLIELEGQSKELILYPELGGTPLLPKP